MHRTADAVEGASLLLLPSAGLDARSWQWLDLSTELPVIRHEYPGHGSRPLTASIGSLDDIADEIVASYPGDYHVVGLSMGGMVAQHLLARHPSRVRSAVIACTSAHAAREVMLDRAAQAEAGISAEMLDTTLRRWLDPATLAAQPESSVVSYVKAALAGLAPGAFSLAWRLLADHDLRGELRGHDVPVTCVAGDADPAAPPAAVRELSEEFKNARLVTVEGPHLLQLDRPREFGSVIEAHLSWAGAA